MAWDKLTVRKEHGGLGFQDLHAFNLALLGKQGWHLLTNHTSLVTRLFKAKYFSKGDFLGAPEGHNPSFVWRSVCITQPMLREGARWIIGDGTSINFWQDIWLRDGGTLTESIHSTDLEGLRVRDVLVYPQRQWNATLLDTILDLHDMARVQNVPLLHTDTHDRHIWRFDTRGHYTVRSGYSLLMDQFGDNGQWRVQGSWDVIWKLQVPLKVRVFLWRSYRDCLPTRIRLQGRGVSCPTLCPCCENELETCWHSLLTCTTAQQCWEELQLWRIIEPKLF